MDIGEYKTMIYTMLKKTPSDLLTELIKICVYLIFHLKYLFFRLRCSQHKTSMTYIEAQPITPYCKAKQTHYQLSGYDNLSGIRIQEALY